MQMTLTAEDISSLVRSPEFRDAIRAAVAEDALVRQALESKRRFIENMVGVFTIGVEADIVQKVVEQLVGEEQKALRATVRAQVQQFADSDEGKKFFARAMINQLERQIEELRQAAGQ